MSSPEAGRPPGYVADLRELVGHRQLLLPAVSVHITDDSGRLLLVHQVDRAQWGTVGGAVEPGESPADAAVREASEETGLSVEADISSVSRSVLLATGWLPASD